MSFSEFSLQGFSKVRWMGYFAYILWSDTLEWNEASMHRCNALLSTIGNQELVYGVRSSSIQRSAVLQRGSKSITLFGRRSLRLVLPVSSLTCSRTHGPAVFGRATRSCYCIPLLPLDLFSDTKVCWRWEIDVREDVNWCLTVIWVIGWA